MKDTIISQLRESAEVKLRTAEELSDSIANAAGMVLDCFRNGGKVLLIGNGGSAADAQHIAGELVGNLDPKRKRRALAAIALTTNSSIITALGNDQGYETVFARKVEALATHSADLLIAITTSGSSANILNAIRAAKERNIKVIGFLGKDGGQAKNMVDLPLVVPSNNTQRIQETHITIGHIICDIVEEALVRGTLV